MTHDAEILEIQQWMLRTVPDLERKLGAAIRASLDEVIDGGRTGRWSIEHLEKTEKTYIGTKVEIMLKSLLGLNKGKKLDAIICGQEVDIKWSLRGTWMIPQECVNQICLLVTADDTRSRFSVGLVAANEECLNKGCNQDRKKTLNQVAREKITWVVRNGKLPQNLLLHLPQHVREKILTARSGQARVVSLFREVQQTVISRDVVQTLAQQDDPMKRVRDARKRLKGENILILGGQEESHRILLARYRLPALEKGEFLSVSIA